MEAFMLALDVVMPLFVWMALGYLLKKAIGLNQVWSDATNRLVFRLLMPVLLFRNMSQSSLSSALSGAGPLLLLGILGLVITFVLLWITVPLAETQDARRGVLIQGIFRPNTALFGLPVALSIYGEGQIALIALLMAAAIPILNISSVLALTRFSSGGEGNARANTEPVWKRILLPILKNPLIIGIVLGTLASLIHLQLPAFLSKAVKGIADCATPVSFLALGSGFSFASAARNRGAITAAVLLRLFAIPLVWISLGALLGFRGQQIAALLVIFAPPTAVTSYTMASTMGGDSQLASEIVVFTSAVSILSMFVWIFLLRQMQLL